MLGLPQTMAACTHCGEKTVVKKSYFSKLSTNKDTNHMMSETAYLKSKQSYLICVQ